MSSSPPAPPASAGRRPPSAPPPAGEPGAAWQAGWALGFGALAGLILLLAPQPPATGVLAGLGLAILPAAVGALGFGAAAGADIALGLWLLSAALGAALAGGLSGPLGPVLAGPVLAACAIAAPRGRGLPLALGGVLVTGALSLFISPPAAPAAPGLREGVLLIVLAAAAFAIARRPLTPPPTVADAEAPAEDPAPPTEDLRSALAEAQAGRAAAEARAEGRARFIAQMSHELRTPLNAIQGFSDIMRTRLFGPIPDRYGEYAELIHESGRHLTELINDVLDISKIEADRYELRLEAFDAREAVTDAMRLLRVQAEEAGVALRALLPSAPVEVDADRRAIKQMVLNLVSNALKFTPRGGGVDVTLREAAGALEIAVADTGVGIAPDDLERLGRPYAQAQAGRDAPQGTGLGLSLVRAFARLHGGELSLESRLGEGTAATVRLPVLRPAMRAEPG